MWSKCATKAANENTAFIYLCLTSWFLGNLIMVLNPRGLVLECLAAFSKTYLWLRQNRSCCSDLLVVSASSRPAPLWASTAGGVRSRTEHLVWPSLRKRFLSTGSQNFAHRKLCGLYPMSLQHWPSNLTCSKTWLLMFIFWDSSGDLLTRNIHSCNHCCYQKSWGFRQISASLKYPHFWQRRISGTCRCCTQAWWGFVFNWCLNNTPDINIILFFMENSLATFKTKMCQQ